MCYFIPVIRALDPACACPLQNEAPHNLFYTTNIKDWGDSLTGEGEHKELFLQLAKQNEMECNYPTSV